MNARVLWTIAAAGALLATGVAVAPAFGATEQNARAPRRAITARNPGAFTPAAADPRLAAIFARGGFDATSLRFTPAEAGRGARALTVTVRARQLRGSDQTRVAAAATASAIAPIAYSLGASVGWKRFAVTGDVARIDMAQQPGSRERADVAVSYTGNRISGRVKAAADRPLLTGTVPSMVVDPSSYSLDASTSYSLTRNLDVTAGVRYRSDRERLTRIEDRRDSQAVYVGTAFRF